MNCCWVYALTRLRQVDWSDEPNHMHDRTSLGTPAVDRIDPDVDRGIYAYKFVG
jgi:hypothetical protein